MDQRVRLHSSGSGSRPVNRYEIVDPIQPYDVPRSAHAVSMATSAPQIAPNPMYANQSNGVPPMQISPRGQHHADVGGHIYEQADLPHQGSPVPGHFEVRAKTQSEGSMESHELRMKVHDLEGEKRKLEKSLEESHIQLKQLNSILVEKKEAILKYQEQISDLQAENGELRMQARHAPPPMSVSPAEQALQHQLHQVRSQLTVSERRVTELAQNNAQLQVQVSQRAQGESFTLDNLRMEVSQLREENQRLRSRVEVLNHQVSTYSEDFQSERSDRERAQGEIDQLKSETETLRQVIQIMAQDHNIRLQNYGMGELANQIVRPHP